MWTGSWGGRFAARAVVRRRREARPGQNILADFHRPPPDSATRPARGNLLAGNVCQAADAPLSRHRRQQKRRDALLLAVSRLAKLAGLTAVTPHTCRHTFAKSLLDNGVTLEQVAALLGHESLDTTRLYVTPGERDLEQAVAKLEA